jgi:hypothetical protein
MAVTVGKLRIVDVMGRLKSANVPRLNFNKADSYYGLGVSNSTLVKAGANGFIIANT